MKEKKRNLPTVMTAVEGIEQQLLLTQRKKKPPPKKGRPIRPPGNPVELAVRLIGGADAWEIAAKIGIHRTTMYRLMHQGHMNNSPHQLVRRFSELSRVKMSLLAPKTYTPDEDD